MPKVSVIVPVYQVEKYIKNCMKSIKNQSFKDFELILVNDGTKDNSIENALSVIRDSDILYRVIDKENGGLSSARNAGVNAARGEWMVFVDSDDVLAEDYLKQLYEAGSKSGLDVSIANIQTVNETELFKKPKYLTNPEVMQKQVLLDSFLVRKISIVVTVIMIKREAFIANNLWFDESIRFGEDAHFYWRLLLSQEKIVYNKTPLYNYFVREGSITTAPTVEKMLTNYQAFLKLHDYIKYNTTQQFADFVLARQCFAMLRISAVFKSYQEFLNVYNKLEFNKYRKVLLQFPDVRVKLLCASMFLSKRVFYVANHGRL